MESNTEVTNKRDDRNAPTNGYEELDKMTVPPNKADRDLDMMFNLLNGLWLAPKHRYNWIDSLDSTIQSKYRYNYLVIG